MNKFLALCSLVLSLILAPPARATPETFIEIRDEAFGISEDELFLLRTTLDNMGSYYETRLETFLVAISLNTGEQQSWHISSATITTQLSEEGEEETQKLEYLPTAKKVDPFAILAGREGILWQSLASQRPKVQPKAQKFGPDAVMFTYPQLADFVVTKEAAQAYRRSAIRQLASDIPDYPRNRQMTTREFIVERLTHSKPCDYAFGDVGNTPLEPQPVYLVRMTCVDEDGLEPTSLLVLAEEVLVSASTQE